MKQLVVILILCSLSACGMPKSSSDTSKSLVSYGAAMSAPASLKDAELAAMTEICNALKFKRLNFQALHFGYTYKFDVNELACDQSQYKTTRVTASLVGDQFISSYTGSYHKSLETDSVGLLATVCSSLLNGVVPLNTEVTGLNTARQLSATSVGEGVIAVDVLYAERADSSSKYFIKSSDELKIVYNSSATPSWRGMVVSRKTSEPCASGSTQAYKVLDSQFVTP